MPGIQKLHLEEALDDGPQIRSLLGVFEEDIHKLRHYASTLHRCCSRILEAQNELNLATQALSGHLKAYENTHFPLDSDSHSILAETMKQFANTVDEASSWHQIMVSQLADGMMFPLAKFLDFDLKEIVTLRDLFQHSSAEADKALSKFSKLSKKKDTERERCEANEDVYTTRKKFHQTALNYYARLNALQYKRKTALVEPVLGYLQALKSHYTLGFEALAVAEVDDFLANISASVQGVHAEFAIENQKTSDLIESIEKQSQHLYHAEPTSNMPYIPANTTLVQKSGYLFQRTVSNLDRKFAGVMTRWDRVFFFTQGGNMMSVAKGEMAGSLSIELDNNVTVMQLDNEDRRNMFQITNGNKTLVLQALNERERDEWLCAIQNVIRDGGYVKGAKAPSRSASRSSQSSIEKLPLASNSSIASHGLSESGRRACGSSSKSIKLALTQTPIVFDMISPTKKETSIASAKAGPPMRINPFTQSSTALATDTLPQNSVFHEVFVVRFLGSIEVPFDRGEQLVHETMRHILAARAIHNVFKMTESHMMVTEDKLSLIDPSNQATKAEYQLQDVSYWAAHRENNRLVAFITRANEDGGQIKFNCHVFESDSSGDEICNTLNIATKIAFNQLMEREKMEKFRQKEKEILLHNISLQADIEPEPKPSQPPPPSSEEQKVDEDNTNSADREPLEVPNRSADDEDHAPSNAKSSE